MISRVSTGWQWILADLALILFLVTLAALASAAERAGPNFANTLSDDVAPPMQAVYRPSPGIIPFGEWLSDQPLDPRAQLTIRAEYSIGAAARAWDGVNAMIRDAEDAGYAPKVIVTPVNAQQSEPDNSFDVYASFSYDAQLAKRSEF